MLGIFKIKQTRTVCPVQGKRYRMKKVLLVLFTLGFIGCTDAEIGLVRSIGDSAKVICYSGGKVVFEDSSTGKVLGLEAGGWAFVSKNHGYVQTFADCFVMVE